MTSTTLTNTAPDYTKAELIDVRCPACNKTMRGNTDVTTYTTALAGVKKCPHCSTAVRMSPTCESITDTEVAYYEQDGIDLSAKELDKKAVTKVAYKAPAKAVTKPSKAKVHTASEIIQEVADTFIAANADCAKAGDSVVPLTGDNTAYYDNQMECLGYTAAHRAIFTQELRNHTALSAAIYADLLREFYAPEVASLKAAVKAHTAKKPAAKPAKGALSEPMRAELAACAAGTPSATKLGSCMRMHLKMKGLLTDAKAGTVSPEGRAIIDSLNATVS